jgi:hypothetical protein
MPYKMDTEILISGRNEKYIISKQHRFHRSGKSIWTINEDEEISCFIQSMSSNWKYNNKAWGLYLSNGTLSVLGKNDKNVYLKIAKFLDGSNTNIWHGYPADYIRNTQDRPTTHILYLWVNLSCINKSDMLKIRKGLKRNL